MNVSTNFYEINSIDKELQRLRKQVQSLNKRRKQLVDKIIENLSQKGENEFTYKGEKYIIEEKHLRSRKGDKKRREETMSILNEVGYYGEEADEVYSKLSNAFQGPEKIIRALKTVKTNGFK